MIFPNLKSLTSPDLNEPELPQNTLDCSVLVEAEIGSDEHGGDIFSFVVVTPEYLQRDSGTRWGRGCLIVSEFTWDGVRSALNRLMAHASRETWDAVAAELSKELHWEFENYTDV